MSTTRARACRRRLAPSPRERGQALLLGVVALLVLAVGMYTSYNLSRTVYEKIALQNAADAAAYSLATLEARSFNFIAFTNRAQAASYVQMLEAHSTLSAATYVVGMAGYLGDVLISTGRMLQAPPFMLVPGMVQTGESLKLAGRGLEQAHDLGQPLLRARAADARRFVQRASRQNDLLFAVSYALVLTTAARLLDSASDLVQANDPGARLNPLSVVLALRNVDAYRRALDVSAAGAGGDDAAAAERARRGMAEVVNATRLGSSTPRFVVDRPRLSSFDSLVPTLQDATNRRWPSQGATKSALEQLASNIAVASAGFVGTAKMLTGRELPEEIDDLEDDLLADTGTSRADRSLLARGDALAAKDMDANVDVPPFGAIAGTGFASIAAVTERAGAAMGRKVSRYCRYEKPERYGQHLGPEIVQLLAEPGRFGFRCEVDRGSGGDFDFTWPGMSRFLTFASPAEGESSDHQPDTWVFLHKPTSAMERAGGRDLTFAIERGVEKIELDARIGEAGVLGTGLAPGMSALARAQAYYHRPGAWREPPNFFNPYWGARLAPKGEAITRMLDEAGLSGQLAAWVADNVWMF